MPIAFACPGCRAEIRVPERHAGQTGSCPWCRASVVVPVGPVVGGVPSAKDMPTEVSHDPESAAASDEHSASRDPDEVEKARVDPKKRFGRFVLLAELGRGGMGAVYRAYDEKLRRTVALKLMLENADPAARRRFEREAHAVARLRHPSIVAIHDVGETEGRPWLAMDLVVGKTLKRRLRPVEGEAQLQLTKAIEVVRDVARAVQHAHEQGVLHRDLKPDNVIVEDSGRALVLDFGIAKLRDGASRLTKTGSMLGTPAYMPPEQAGVGEADARSDVYSLGATLYFALTGKPPFDGPSDLNVVAAVLRKAPVSPRAMNPRVAPDLETICLRCLEKDQDRRYPSAAALADELDRFLAGDAIHARPIGRVESLWRWARRNKVAAGLTASFVAILGAGAVVIAGERARLEAARRDEREKARRELRATPTAARPSPGAGTAAQTSTREDAELQTLMDEMGAAHRQGSLGGFWTTVEIADKALARFPHHRDSWQVYGLRGSTYLTLAQDLLRQQRYSEAGELVVKSQDDVEAALRSAPDRLSLEEQATVRALREVAISANRAAADARERVERPDPRGR